MKLLPRFRVLSIVMVNIFFISAFCRGQHCSNGSPALTLSYDTLLSGTGNQVYNFGLPHFDTSHLFNFPMFDPSKGTLVQVDIQSMVSVRYSYTLENTNQVPLTYNIMMIRTDSFRCSALLDPVGNEMLKKVATHKLIASDNISNSGNDYVEAGKVNPLYSYKNYPIDYSFTNSVTGFLGNGKVIFDYQTVTDFYPSGSSLYSWNPVTNDSIYFKLTYHYCLTTSLPAGISNFAATRLSSGSIQLNWLAPDDYTGKTYVVEKSPNGTTYTPVSSIVSNSNSAKNYSTLYTPVHGDKNKLFFRVKVIEKNGAFTFSNIRDVSLPGEGMMVVFPTVIIDAVNIYFPATATGDYLVNIRSVTGQLMQQSSYSNSSKLKIVINKKLPAGLYVVEAINKRTGESQQSKIIAQ